MINVIYKELDVESVTYLFILRKKQVIWKHNTVITSSVNKKCDEQNFMNQCFIMWYSSAWFMVVQICYFFLFVRNYWIMQVFLERNYWSIHVLFCKKCVSYYFCFNDVTWTLRQTSNLYLQSTYFVFHSHVCLKEKYWFQNIELTASNVFLKTSMFHTHFIY